MEMECGRRRECPSIDEHGPQRRGIDGTALISGNYDSVARENEGEELPAAVRTLHARGLFRKKKWGKGKTWDETRLERTLKCSCNLSERTNGKNPGDRRRNAQGQGSRKSRNLQSDTCQMKHGMTCGKSSISPRVQSLCVFL